MDRSMLAAIEAVKDSESVRKAAMDFNVPKSMLGDLLAAELRMGKGDFGIGR